MEYQRTILVGDLHGCLEEFDELLKKVSFTKGSDRLILLGDLIDRGPDGIGVIRRAQELGCESVLGNHDYQHIRWRKHEDKRKLTGKKNKMRPFIESRRLENELLTDEDLAWLKSLPLTINLGNNWVAVHGGFQPNLPIYDQKDDKIIRMRFVNKDTLEPVSVDDDFVNPHNSMFWAYGWKGPENVIYGHAVHGNEPLHTVTPIEPPFEVFRDSWPSEVQTLGIDTGVCFGGRLTAIITTDVMNTWETVQVDAKRVYRVVVGGVKMMGGRAPSKLDFDET